VLLSVGVRDARLLASSRRSVLTSLTDCLLMSHGDCVSDLHADQLLAEHWPSNGSAHTDHSTPKLADADNDDNDDDDDDSDDDDEHADDVDVGRKRKSSAKRTRAPQLSSPASTSASSSTTAPVAATTKRRRNAPAGPTVSGRAIAAVAAFMVRVRRQRTCR
jgi:hypothetical protein